ncbi:Uncharacterised protein [Mannheimia haemolytica]|uniref:Uncharacterized protein n=1 Tax=Mannheimia haemolytica TaxID=75985 RepID=A0A378N4P5_MANHA|nr:Uncharacterised protein [Mannheimia haemolytica]
MILLFFCSRLNRLSVFELVGKFTLSGANVNLPLSQFKLSEDSGEARVAFLLVTFLWQSKEK